MFSSCTTINQPCSAHVSCGLVVYDTQLLAVGYQKKTCTIDRPTHVPISGTSFLSVPTTALGPLLAK